MKLSEAIEAGWELCRKQGFFGLVDYDQTVSPWKIKAVCVNGAACLGARIDFHYQDLQEAFPVLDTTWDNLPDDIKELVKDRPWASPVDLLEVLYHWNDAQAMKKLETDRPFQPVIDLLRKYDW